MAEKLPNKCPSCHRHLMTTQLQCNQCGVNVSGYFVSFFHQFSDEDQLFIKIFVLNDGNLKSVAQETNKSYPTVRKMLDQIISKMD